MVQDGDGFEVVLRNPFRSLRTDFTAKSVRKLSITCNEADVFSFSKSLFPSQVLGRCGANLLQLGVSAVIFLFEMVIKRN